LYRKGAYFELGDLCGNSIIVSTLDRRDRPQYLLLHLKRFVWVKKDPPVPQAEENVPPNGAEPPSEFVFQKNKAAVAIPESLTLDPFCKEAHDAPPRPSSQYKLKSIVHHIGQRPYSGHYIAHALRPRKDDLAQDAGQSKSPVSPGSLLNAAKPVQVLKETPDRTVAPSKPDSGKEPLDPYQWVAFDDTYTAIVDLQEILKSPSRQSTAYMLLYALEDESAPIAEGGRPSSA
jgi:Ubiquitin carboxyl-terminal hydrolase